MKFSMLNWGSAATSHDEHTSLFVMIAYIEMRWFFERLSVL